MLHHNHDKDPELSFWRMLKTMGIGFVILWAILSLVGLTILGLLIWVLILVIQKLS